MDAVVSRLQAAADLSEKQNQGRAKLPDAVAVAEECGSWGVGGQLKPHQTEGVAWLIRRYAAGVNVILGDEMGLGKTLQSVALLAYLVSQGRSPGPFYTEFQSMLLDMVYVYTRKHFSGFEMAKFTSSLKVLQYIGDKNERKRMRTEICQAVNEQSPKSRADPALPFHVLLTTYELAMLDASFLSRFRWRYCIVDEAHRLKNSSTVLYRALQNQYMIPRRLLLTGTPVQNNLSELWALLHFCMPSVFDNMDDFLEAFGSAVESLPIKSSPNEEDDKFSADESAQRLQALRDVLKAFMLRRTKGALVQANALGLPPIVEVAVFAPLVPIQKKVFFSLVKKEAPKISSATSKQSLQNIVMQLRKACSHPYLFDGVEPEPFVEGEHLVEASGKLLMLDMLLRRLHSEGHHVLLFAQMTRTLDIIQDYLEYRGYTYERLDGSLRAEERFAAVRSFSGSGAHRNPESAFLFLLTTRAGGVGLNLVAADTVIFFEQDWNPQADKQALQRAHRIGQDRSVLVINIITEDTIEEVIFQRAKAKLELTHNVIGNEKSKGEEEELEDIQNSDLQSMIVFGLRKIVGTPAASLHEKDADAQLSDKEDIAARMHHIVDGALAKRANFESIVSENDASGNSGTNELRRAPSTIAEEARDLNQIMNEKGSENHDDLEVLKSLQSGEGEANDEASLQRAQRTNRKRVPPPDDESLAEAKKKQKADRIQSLWESTGYKSLAVDELEDMDENVDDNAEDVEFVQYLVGDCTKPKVADGDSNIILWCVDNSGAWGNGGVFTSLANLYDGIPKAFEEAHRNKDLHLGDLHLVSVPDMQDTKKAALRNAESNDSDGHLWVGLAVVQTYDQRRKAPRSEISVPDLETCIKKLIGSAARLSAAIHMPRIEAGGGWYSVERLLRRYSIKFKVHVNVYYYKRGTR